MNYFFNCFVYMSQLLLANENSSAHLTYDLTADTNRWGLSKDCALKIHQSARDYCAKRFSVRKEINCDSSAFMMNGQASSAPEQKRFIIGYPFIDLPNRSTLVYVYVSSAKDCTYEVKNL